MAMNPLALFGVLTARYADIRRAFFLFSKNKQENSEMVDLVRSLAGDFGVLTQTPTQAQPSVVPPALRKYDTKWIQSSLNKLINAGLAVDGDLGPTGSKTREAVKKFQAAHPPLTPDGDPGVQTVSVLEQEIMKLEAVL